MSHTIALIDDDGFYVEGIPQDVADRWPSVAFTFLTFRSEKAFNDEFDRLAGQGLALAIIDQMIPYTSLSDERLYDEVLQLNSFRGGTRCYDVLRGDVRTKSVPIVFYTILDRETVPEAAEYVKKTGDSGTGEFLEVIGRLLRLS